MWDVRSFKKPVFTSPRIPTLYPETNAVFSPDEKYIVTGAAAETAGGRGSLMFLRRDGLDVEKSIPFDAGESVVRVQWHSKINQVRHRTKAGDGLTDMFCHRSYVACQLVLSACSTRPPSPSMEPSYC